MTILLLCAYVLQNLQIIYSIFTLQNVLIIIVPRVLLMHSYTHSHVNGHPAHMCVYVCIIVYALW